MLVKINEMRRYKGLGKLVAIKNSAYSLTIRGQLFDLRKL